MRRTAWALLGVLAAGVGSCSDGGVVGGRCRFEGCVEPSALEDAGNDVAVDVWSDAEDADGGGNDAKHPDADAAEDGAEAGDAGEAGDAADAGEAGDASDAGEGGDAACTPPFDKPAQCGDCATQCSGATPICAPLDGGYACVAACPPGLTLCAGACVDLQTDPDHCGACGNACPSGICQAGQCVGAAAGHVVLLCMSFEQNQQSSPATALLGNAVFLPAGNPVRILAYDEHSPNNIENKVKQALGWAAAAKGRTYTLTSAPTPAAVLSTLDKQNYEVFLVYDQTNAPAGALGAAGSAWNAALATFVAKGGVVVVSSGGGGTGEMDALLTNAGLLATTAQPTLTGQVLYNNAPSDAVGLNVLSPFLALNRTCGFSTGEVPGPGLIFVVTAAADGGGGLPVVVHKVK